jgi:hypothetical protein
MCGLCTRFAKGAEAAAASLFLEANLIPPLLPYLKVAPLSSLQHGGLCGCMGVS